MTASQPMRTLPSPRRPAAGLYHGHPAAAQSPRARPDACSRRPNGGGRRSVQQRVARIDAQHASRAAGAVHLGRPAVKQCPRRRRLPASAAAGSAALATATHLLSAFKLSVFLAACKGAFKVGLICLGVTYLVRRGTFTRDVPRVLSVVAFNLTIPCMLFTQIAATLSADGQRQLLMLPLAAMCQVAIGLVLGHFAGLWAEREPPPAAAPDGGSSAHRIAASVALAAGLPAECAAVLALPPPAPPPGLRMLVQTACAFGNSLTLPFIMLLAILPQGLEPSVAGCVALFLMGWSPCFWTLGYAAVTRAVQPAEPELAPVGVVPAPPSAWSVGPMAPGDGDGGPRNGSSAPVIDVTLLPQDMADLPSIRELSEAEQRGGQTSIVPAAAPGRAWAPTALTPLRSAATPSRLVVGQTPSGGGADRGGGGGDARFAAVKRALNPPVVATLLGVLAGCTPIGALLLHPASACAASIATSLPWELAALLSMCRCAAEVMTLLGSSTLALQAITLGGSLGTSASGGTGWRGLLMPSDRWEARLLIASGVVRWLLMPLAGVGVVALFSRLNLLPDNPVAKLTLLVMSCMPSAQNLVVLTNLNDATKSLAPLLAKLLFRQYALCVLPMTFWVSLFFVYVGLPVA